MARVSASTSALHEWLQEFENEWHANGRESEAIKSFELPDMHLYI